MTQCCPRLHLDYGSCHCHMWRNEDQKEADPTVKWNPMSCQRPSGRLDLGFTFMLTQIHYPNPLAYLMLPATQATKLGNWWETGSSSQTHSLQVNTRHSPSNLVNLLKAIYINSMEPIFTLPLPIGLLFCFELGHLYRNFFWLQFGPSEEPVLRVLVRSTPTIIFLVLVDLHYQK